MPGRQANAADYRYGFNGKEKDNELKGSGNSYDYGMRMQDPRVARFLSVDPLTKSYPWYTPYQFAGNDPIRNIDIDGLEGGSTIEQFFNSAVNSVRNWWNGDNSSTPTPPAPNQPAPPVKKGQATSAVIKVVSAPQVGNMYNTTNNTNTDDWVSMFNEKGEKCYNCAISAQKTLANNGVVQSWEKIQMAKENDEGTAILLSDKPKINAGIDYLNSQLQKGNYVKVGVNHTLSSTDDYYKGVGIANNDNSTDHWLTITDILYDEKAKLYYYRYFENGTRYKDKGTSPDNRLYINPDGSIKGGNSVEEPGNSGKYQLTQIRKNSKT